MDYDKDRGRLKVSEGEFPGHEVKSADRATVRIVDNAEEYAESIVGSAEEENYLAGKENFQLLIVYDRRFKNSALEMIDLCHFNLSLVKLF